MRHLLVTNDFPPKVGGIQSYLWELWRRLPPESFCVLTTPYHGGRAWDAGQTFEVRRTTQRWLLPTPGLVRQINSLAADFEASFVVMDPVLPLGLAGPRLDLPYVAVAHGAEYTIPWQLPVTRPLIAQVTRQASGIIASGRYVESVVRAVLRDDATTPVISIAPGVDPARFRPLSEDARQAVRATYGITSEQQLVVGVGRLVPRKGFDRLVLAAALLRDSHPGLRVLIAGEGRHRRALTRLAGRLGAPVTLLGRIPADELPALYAAADVFCMPCHDRWGGLEAEGFGIVFCEAAAAGVPVVAGTSGGSVEAVDHGGSGLLVPPPVTPDGVAGALRAVLDDARRRRQLGAAGRRRVLERFSYDHLAAQLLQFLARQSAVRD